jgi:hypothetical protein
MIEQRKERPMIRLFQITVAVAVIYNVLPLFMNFVHTMNNVANVLP